MTLEVKHLLLSSSIGSLNRHYSSSYQGIRHRGIRHRGIRHRGIRHRVIRHRSIFHRAFAMGASAFGTAVIRAIRASSSRRCIMCHSRLATLGRQQLRITDGNSLGISWGRFNGALLFMSIMFHYVFLISILIRICICTFDGCEIRIKGFRDCLDL